MQAYHRLEVYIAKKYNIMTTHGCLSFFEASLFRAVGHFL